MGYEARILIAEDEAIVAKDIERQAVEFGHAVVGIAASGQEAIKLAESHQPDVVLMDIRLKGSMDGIETARAIRSRLGCGIVFVTAHGDMTTAWRAATTFPSAYVVKPFDEATLSTAIILAFVQKLVSSPIDKALVKADDTAHRLAALDSLMRKHLANDLMLLGDLEQLRGLCAGSQDGIYPTADQMGALLDRIINQASQIKDTAP